MKYIKLFNEGTESRESKSRDIVVNGILNRGGTDDFSNVYLNKHCKIEWKNKEILILKFPYSVIPIINKTLYFDYEVNFTNNTLVDKNFLGKTYNLTQEESDKIFNKYYFHGNK